jgi:hypothetical protein
MSLYFLGSAESAGAMSRDFRVFNRILGLVFTWLLLAPQRRRFAIFETGDDEPASLWGPGIGIMVVSYGVLFALFSFLAFQK